MLGMTEGRLAARLFADGVGNGLATALRPASLQTLRVTRTPSVRRVVQLATDLDQNLARADRRGSRALL